MKRSLHKLLAGLLIVSLLISSIGITAFAKITDEPESDTESYSAASIDEAQLGTDTYAVNPFLPPYEYIPDAEPYIFTDPETGEQRVYIYGSQDLADGTNYCQGDYVTYSAPLDDLSDWRYEGVIYRRLDDPYVQINDDPNNNLYAPDVVEKDGKYYLYYGVSDLYSTGIGVAVADGPAGPFTYIGRVQYTEGEEPQGRIDSDDGLDDGSIAFAENRIFDPAVFLDDDGRVYMYFGFMNGGYVVELDPADMRTVKYNEDYDAYSIQIAPGAFSGDTSAWGGNGYFEAPSMRKIGNTYYYVYSSFNIGGGASFVSIALSYATSDSPIGPFTYGGVLISAGDSLIEGNTHSTYYVDNIHGGMVEVGGQWYIIYHRHTNNDGHTRQACAEAITIAQDGSIEQAEFTSQGLNAAPLGAYYRWPAYIACNMWDANGNVSNNSASPYHKQVPYDGNYESYTDDHSGAQVNMVVTNTTNGSVAGYKYFDFGSSAPKEMSIEFRAESAGTVTAYLDEPYGTEIAQFTITEDITDWTVITEKVKTFSGVHAVYFVFETEGETLGELSYFTFFEKEVSSYRSCVHTYSYKLADDSYEATDTTDGYRHYVCEECGAEYEYNTDPLVYEANPVTGGPVDHAGASNPVLPTWEHIPDGEPHVFWSRDDNEWRVYIYGSHDEDGTGYCGHDFILWSAPVYDMSEWRCDGVIYDSREDSGSNHTGRLYAPDAEYDVTTDTYYLAVHELAGNIRLLPADNPKGSWIDEETVWSKSFMGCFDPTIYIEDGTIYVAGSVMPYYFNLLDRFEQDEEVKAMYREMQAKVLADGYNSGMGHIAVLYQLKDDPTEGIEKISWFANEERDYLPVYEGLSLDGYVEDLGKYVMLYVSYEQSVIEGVAGTNSCIAYMYADSIEGPWYYGDNGMDGVDINTELPDDYVLAGNHGNIISDTSGRYHRDPVTGDLKFDWTPTFPYSNNHGGMAKINGEWYFFGHRQTNEHAYSRQSVAGKINLYLDEEGLPVIEPMEFTSSGVADSLDAYQTWEAGITTYLMEAIDQPANFMENNARSTTNPYIVANRDQEATHAAYIDRITDGNIIGYKYLDFGDKPANVALNLLVTKSDDYADGKATVLLDAPSVAKGGTVIGSIDITAAAISAATEKETATDGTVWSWISAEMDAKVSGVHAVYFVLEGSDEDSIICRLDEFGFTALTELPFTDVSEDDWFYEEVAYVYKRGLMIGTSATEFEPMTKASRAMAVTALWRMDGSPKATKTAGFTDLTHDWYREAVAWAAENGIVKGYSKTEFGPADDVTREQLAAMFYRYAEYKGYDVTPASDLAGYTDVNEISSWALQEMKWANAVGLIIGRTDTTLVPQGTGNRAELATLLMRWEKTIIG